MTMSEGQYQEQAGVADAAGKPYGSRYGSQSPDSVRKPDVQIAIHGDPAALFAALAAAQPDIPRLEKNRTVRVTPRKRSDGYQPPPYTFDYATLDAVLDCLRVPYAKQGLTVLQPLSRRGPRCELQTWICHASGSRIVATVEFDAPGDVQDLGKAVTYLRRYSLSTLTGLCAEEDDDGNSADGNERQTGDRSRPPPPPNGQQAPQAARGSGGGGKGSSGKASTGKAQPAANQEVQRQPVPGPSGAAAGGVAPGSAVANQPATKPDNAKPSEPPPAQGSGPARPMSAAEAEMAMGGGQVVMRQETWDEIMALATETWADRNERRDTMVAIIERETGLTAAAFKEGALETQAQRVLARVRQMKGAV